MKTLSCFLLTLFAIMFIANNNTQAQNFAPVGATWYYTFTLPQIPPPPLGISFTKFESTKDTLVNAWNCKKIQLSRTYNCCGNIVNTIDYYILYSIDNKVYEIENNQQYLLYDFSKNTGEYWVLPKYDNDTVFVDSVSNIVLTNGQTRRVQHVHNSSFPFSLWFVGDIIENIGYKEFLFPFIFYVPCNDGGSLRCYYEYGNIVQSELLPCDLETVGIKKNNVEQDKIVINNPVENNIEIQITDLSLLSLSNITVYDNLGKLICQQNNITGKNYMIDFSDKCNGVYFVKILLNNNQILVKKIIKQ